MKDISQKISHLLKQKEALDQKLLELKKDNLQKLASALTLIQDVEKVDFYTLIGAVLESLTKEPKEDLLKAGKMFCKKHKSQLQSLLGTRSKKEPASKKTDASSGKEKTDGLYSKKA